MSGRPSPGARPTVRWASVAAAVGCAALLAACGKAEHRGAAPAGARPVAVVAGQAVPAAWVAAAEHSEALAAPAALDRAVETAALGHLAREHGLDRSPTLAAERRSVLVRMLLARRAEIADPPSARDRAELERAYHDHETRFVHPELRTVEHLVVVLDPTGGRHRAGAPTADQPPEAWDDARETLAGLLPLARGAVSADAFGALQATLQRRWKERWTGAGRDARQVPQVRAERIGPFDTAGDGYDPAFVAAAFGLHAPGDVSEPVRTAFGWHVLYLADVQPARQTGFDEALPEILEKARTAIETQRAAGLVREASVRRGVQEHGELLTLTTRGGTEAAAR